MNKRDFLKHLVAASIGFVVSGTLRDSKSSVNSIENFYDDFCKLIRKEPDCSLMSCSGKTLIAILNSRWFTRRLSCITALWTSNDDQNRSLSHTCRTTILATILGVKIAIQDTIPHGLVLFTTPKKDIQVGYKCQ